MYFFFRNPEPGVIRMVQMYMKEYQLITLLKQVWMFDLQKRTIVDS